ELVIPSLTNDDGSDSELPEMDILSEPAGDELPVDSNPIPRG
ncbi:MAG: hypothetical protein ACJATP_001252, partial [Candidatus Azotimanducaceae bacterium]